MGVLFGVHYVCLVLFGERKWPRYIGVCGKSGRGKSGFYCIYICNWFVNCGKKTALWNLFLSILSGQTFHRMF